MQDKVTTTTPPAAPPAAPAAPAAQVPAPAAQAADAKPAGSQAEASKVEQPFSDPLVAELITAAGVKSVDELKTLVGQRIPDLMSLKDKAEGRARTAEAEVAARDEKWDKWIRDQAVRGVPARDIMATLDRFKTDRTKEAEAGKGSHSSTLEVVNAAYRSGDGEFARFLERIAEDVGSLDPAKLERYRTTFTELKKGTPAAAASTTSPGNGHVTATPAAQAEPPRVTAPGSSGPAAEPAWKGGDMARSLLSSRKK